MLGVLISLCLKFDHHLVGKKKLKSGQTPYFTSAMVFYFLGLATTMGVMHVFKAAQPALLYLSPAGILSVLLTAIIRGELKQVLAFTTEAASSVVIEEEGDDDYDVDADADVDQQQVNRKTSKNSPGKRRTVKKNE